MKTALRTHFRRLAMAAIPAGLVAFLVAAALVPGFQVNPDLAATALGGLIVYTFLALALLDRRRLRIGAERAGIVEVDDDVVALPVPARRPQLASQSAAERLAA